MTAVARTLPAAVARRFRGATRAQVRCGEASFEALVAEGFGLRLRGLAGLEADRIVPLLIPRCRSVHTFGMRAAIDVVWLELSAGAEGSVLDVDAEAGPRRLLGAPRSASRGRSAALELAAGDAERFGLAAGAPIRIVR
jgi:uncharacterized membrane protein (UPF0127 family)